MFLKSMLLVAVGIIIFALSLVISYEVENFPSIAFAILSIIGFAFLIAGAILCNKSFQKK